MHRRRFLALVSAAAAFRIAPLRADTPNLFIEDLTWMELRDAVAAGCRTAIVPTGGTEQNGPHMALGKHNLIVRHAAEEIARRLGHTLVAPVIAYVPEGRFDPPDGHMRFPGTVGVSEATFATLLHDAASGLALAGFSLILFVGDHGGSQPTQERVAARLTRVWRSRRIAVANLGRYYGANGQQEWLKAQGFSDAAIGQHASVQDTTELLAVAPDRVRRNLLSPSAWPPGPTGAVGDPTSANSEVGARLIDLKVAAGVAQAREILAGLGRR
jgi:creatinine amidohydrolase